MTAIGEAFEYGSIQTALDDLDDWEGAKISITSSYDESNERFPIEINGRRNRVIIEDQRHSSDGLGHTITSPVDAVIKLDTGLHRPPGVQFHNLYVNGNDYADHGILGLSERRSLYRHLVVQNCRSHGIYLKRNGNDDATNSHTWIGCFTHRNGGDGIRVEGNAHGLTLYDHDSNMNEGYGARIVGGASCVAFGGAYQNNGAEGIYASGVWDFHALGSYFERVSSSTPGGQAGAEIRLEGQHCASVNFCYGNGGNRTDHMLALRSIQNASVRSTYGWHYDQELINVDGCSDVDVHANTCRHIRGSPNSTTVVDPSNYASGATRPRSHGIIGGASAPLSSMPDGAFEGDVGLHPSDGMVVWRNGSWQSV